MASPPPPPHPPRPPQNVLAEERVRHTHPTPRVVVPWGRHWLSVFTMPCRCARVNTRFPRARTCAPGRMEARQMPGARNPPTHTVQATALCGCKVAVVSPPPRAPRGAKLLAATSGEGDWCVCRPGAAFPPLADILPHPIHASPLPKAGCRDAPTPSARSGPAGRSRPGDPDARKGSAGLSRPQLRLPEGPLRGRSVPFPVQQAAPSPSFLSRRRRPLVRGHPRLAVPTRAQGGRGLP